MIVIAALPLVITNRILAAPAVLKSALNKHGFDSIALDLNHEVLLRIDASYHKEELYGAFLQNKFNDNIIRPYQQLVTYCANQILKHAPTKIFLSLFCLDCKSFCLWLCAELRQRTDKEIIIGGPGCLDHIWIKKMLSLELIDGYILGDGEISVPEYVKGNKSYPGINGFSWEMLPSLENSVVPDYSDYDFSSYLEPSIPLIDSRGCVQSCEFCDVIEKWTKFQYKTADEIFEEMMYQIKKYKVYHFDFRSSISNGNFKEFKKLMKKISNYNDNKFRSQQISWEGSFIARSSKNEELFADMQNTNCTIFLGVESLSERVRKQIGKNFSNNDLDWHLKQIKKYNIDAKLLLMSAYPTETREDWEETKQWFIDHKHYAESIRSVQIGNAMVLPDTKLERKSAEYGIEVKSILNWTNKNLDIDIHERLKYHNDLRELCKSLGYTVS